MSTATGEPEVLDAEVPPSRTLRVVLVVLALALVVGVLAWLEGVRRAPGERRAIDACSRAATTAVDDAEVRLALMVNYVGPVMGTTSGDVDAGLRRLVAGQAPGAREPVDEALTRCRDVEVWPLNTEHREALAAVDAFLVAERRRLLALEQDDLGFYAGYDEVVALRRELERLLPAG